MLERPTVLFIPCPIQMNEYAGWAYQMQRFKERNDGTMRIRLLYQPITPSTAGKATALTAFRFARAARREIVKEREACIVIFPMFFFPNMLLALLLPRRIPYVVRISGNELTRGNRLIFLIRKKLLQCAQSVITLNQQSGERLSALGVAPARRVVLSNSVGNHFRPPSDAERRSARAAYGIKDGETVVGTVGTICRRKQQRMLIEAAANGKGENTVLICGPSEGHKEADAQYAEECRTAADKLGVNLIATGQVKNVREIYWALDIFALPSDREGMPNALLEAMACGLPCIASDIPGCREVISPGVTGLLAPRRGMEAFANHIRMLTETPEIRSRLGQAAFEYVVKNLSARQLDHRLLDILQIAPVSVEPAN